MLCANRSHAFPWEFSYIVKADQLYNQLASHFFNDVVNTEGVVKPQLL